MSTCRPHDDVFSDTKLRLDEEVDLDGLLPRMDEKPRAEVNMGAVTVKLFAIQYKEGRLGPQNGIKAEIHFNKTIDVPRAVTSWAKDKSDSETVYYTEFLSMGRDALTADEAAAQYRDAARKGAVEVAKTLTPTFLKNVSVTDYSHQVIWNNLGEEGMQHAKEIEILANRSDISSDTVLRQVTQALKTVERVATATVRDVGYKAYFEEREKKNAATAPEVAF